MQRVATNCTIFWAPSAQKLFFIRNLIEKKDMAVALMPSGSYSCKKASQERQLPRVKAWCLCQGELSMFRNLPRDLIRRRLVVAKGKTARCSSIIHTFRQGWLVAYVCSSVSGAELCTMGINKKCAMRNFLQFNLLPLLSCRCLWQRRWLWSLLIFFWPSCLCLYSWRIVRVELWKSVWRIGLGSLR